MVSESANLVKLYEEKSKSPETVFEMVFHPNGNLNGGWVDNEDILLGYEKNLDSEVAFFVNHGKKVYYWILRND